jgi:hypothetical protein
MLAPLPKVISLIEVNVLFEKIVQILDMNATVRLLYQEPRICLFISIHWIVRVASGLRSLM